MRDEGRLLWVSLYREKRLYALPDKDSSQDKATLLGVIVWEMHPRQIVWSAILPERESGQIMVVTGVQEAVKAAMLKVEEKTNPSGG